MGGWVDLSMYVFMYEYTYACMHAGMNACVYVIY